MKINDQLIKNFQDCVTQSNECFVWDIIEKRLIKIPVNISTVNKSKKNLVLKYKEEHALNFSEVIRGEGTINLWIPEFEIFFQSNLLEFSDEGFLRVKFPKTFEKRDRRKKGRYLANKMVNIQYDYNKRHFSRLCYDIGIGGFSVVYLKSEKVSFKDKEIVSGMKINILGEVFNLDVQVVNKLKLKPFHLSDLPYAGWRVSFRIVNPPKKYQETVRNLFEHLESSTKAN